MAVAKELNVFVDNRPGRLRSVAEVLAESKIDVRTMTLQDHGQYGLMKLIVDKPDSAYHALTGKGFACALKEILAIQLEDKPGSFLALADILSAHNVNVLDAYGFVLDARKSAVFCVEVKDAARIKGILEKSGFKVLGEELYES